jgi:hypothetical protein
MLLKYATGLVLGRGRVAAAVVCASNLFGNVHHFGVQLQDGSNTALLRNGCRLQSLLTTSAA